MWTSEPQKHAELANSDVTAAGWYVRRARDRRKAYFSPGLFTLALEDSNLNKGAKRTMLRTLGTSSSEGITTASGRNIAAYLNIRDATVSDHWMQARRAGLLLTQRRFNAASVQQLCWPGSGIGGPIATDAPLYSHSWTIEELSWWNSFALGPIPAPPWGGGFAPF
ncbi:hypothetical protein J2Y68_001068 [Paenarthrobacter nitroguajacolicus]|nr:hypothetical protein [Paenarthrobacter nitroguajacolicus]